MNPSRPRAVRLMNDGIGLPFEETALPNRFDENGRAVGPVLHIHKIPTEAVDEEPIVIKIEW